MAALALLAAAHRPTGLTAVHYQYTALLLYTTNLWRTLYTMCTGKSFRARIPGSPTTFK